MINKNEILIGSKPSMSYVLAMMTRLSSDNTVKVRARGKSISKAVDVTEIVRNKFMKDAKVSVLIGTQKLENRNKQKVNVSTIEITMTK